MDRPRRASSIALLVVLSWSTASLASSATELVREAKEHEAANEDDVAARRYTEALAIDPTCEPAYLGLGELRARRGDLRESERVFSVALAHVPGLKAALVGRAHARWALGDRAGAEDDLEQYVTDDEAGALRELAAWYGEDARPAAQLATWRRILSVGARSGDAPLVREARTMVRALQILMGPADPVVAPPLGRQPGPIDTDAVRRALAVIARRGG